MYPDTMSNHSSMSMSNNGSKYNVHMSIDLYDVVILTEEQLKVIQDSFQTIVQTMKEATNR